MYRRKEQIGKFGRKEQHKGVGGKNRGWEERTDGKGWKEICRLEMLGGKNRPERLEGNMQIGNVGRKEQNRKGF